MIYTNFASCLEKLEKISSRLEITAILAELFKKTAAEEIDKVCYLSLGRLAPFYAGIEVNMAERMVIRALALAYSAKEETVTASYQKLGDLGKVVQKLSKNRKSLDSGLSVTEVYTHLYTIATTTGAGSQEKKLNLLSGLLKKSDATAAKYIIRIILNKLRLGFSDKTLIEALSWMETGNKSLKMPIERAYFLHPDIGLIAKKLKKGGVRALKEVALTVGVPVIPQLCQRVPTAEAIMEKMTAVASEPKFDGTRVQLHMDRNRNNELGIKNLELDLGGAFTKPKFLVKTFTRNLEENTWMFPDLLEAADKQLQAESVILDGEAVGFNPKTGQILPFQETVQRKRKHGVNEKAAEIPLRLYNFDLLYLNGEDLTGLPLSVRREKLLAIVKLLSGKEGGRSSLAVADQAIIGSAKELDEALDRAHAEGLEGIVLKNPGSPYEAGSRGFNWVKYKRGIESDETGRLSDTIDAVVLGYDKGRGKRTDFGIGAFLVGVYDESTDQFLTIAKIGTGLSDEQWREMQRRCEAIKMTEKPTNVVVNKMLNPDVWTEPKMVVVIRADEITRSPVHSAGYALRFPRLLSWREDKSAQQATSLKEFVELYKDQLSGKKR
ncbi:MAG: ATP-dependent DNA ligase [Patescibacteria group bacterium]